MTRMVKWCVLLGLVTGLFSSHALADRLKDMTSIAGVRSNQLVGYGVVVGLAGTGDGSSGLTLQSLQSMVSQFGLVTDAANLNGKNVASVMVTAEMPAFMKPGQRLDVTVSTIGGAKSLRGGTLLMTPMLGADGETEAGAFLFFGEKGFKHSCQVPGFNALPGILQLDQYLFDAAF